MPTVNALASVNANEGYNALSIPKRVSRANEIEAEATNQALTADELSVLYDLMRNSSRNSLNPFDLVTLARSIATNITP
ncbi:hypothetical protein [Thalassotalea sp. Y01]|uniref:hypothetical protein n=1 Tax=Thalassotalea sp. Y01 TaxID=2729613 RepID=UPI00145F18E2|nr:hypothetical protein [Thalassotalea sp. Y01]NMP16133.1 hypothetical protein [Thalassotalea sp. Y01]